jgi:phosphoserine phosphatase RsbU/P
MLDDELKEINRNLQETIDGLEQFDAGSGSPELHQFLTRQLNSQRFLVEVYRKNQEKISHLESLVNASRVLNSTLVLDEVLRLFMDFATREMRADRSTLYLVDKKRNELWSLITQGPNMVEIRLPIGQGISGRVAETGETINISDPYNDSRFYREIDRKTGYVTRNILCMPMRNKKNEIIGVIQILNKNEGSFTSDDEFYLENLSLQSSVAIENAQLHKEALERRRLESELKLAYQIQKNLLPKADPILDGYSIAGVNIPCLEVGGDYYDYIPMGTTLGIAIGDVSGKGIPASLLMANLQAALKVLGPINTASNAVVDKINLLLRGTSTPNKFITFFYGILDTETKLMRFTNAGHNPPMLLREGREVTYLTTEGLIMGAFSDAVYREEVIRLQDRDVLVFYTDGITETINSIREQFGEDRLQQIVRQNRDRTAVLIRDLIIDEVTSFSGGQAAFDDITLIIMKVTSPGESD